MVVGDDFLRHAPSTLDGLAKERLGTGRVAVITEQHVHDHTVLVDRPIQVTLLTLAEQKDFVDEPPPANPTPAANLGGQQGPEHLDPAQDGAMRNVDAALGQQLQHLAAR